MPGRKKCKKCSYDCSPQSTKLQCSCIADMQCSFPCQQHLCTAHMAQLQDLTLLCTCKHRAYGSSCSSRSRHGTCPAPSQSAHGVTDRVVTTAAVPDLVLGSLMTTIITCSAAAKSCISLRSLACCGSGSAARSLLSPSSCVLIPLAVD